MWWSTVCENAGNWQSVGSHSELQWARISNGSDGGGGGGGVFLVSWRFRWCGGSDCGGGGGGDCFTDITMITLSNQKVEIDGQVKKVYYEKPISEIKVGDYVVNKNKTKTNKAEFIEKLKKTDWDPVYKSTSDTDPLLQ